MNEPIKVLILSDPASSHTSKWVNSLHRKGIQLKLFGLSDFNKEEYDNGIKIKIVDFSKSAKTKSDGDLRKIIYLKAIIELKKIIKSFKPDIVHAHYASSYGLLGALSRFKPFLVSVWGNDVYDFPKKSVVHKKVFQFVMRASDRIFSTSKIMADEILKYTDKSIKVIPFGIDTDVFKPFSVNKIFEPDTIILGAVKSLSYKYGNDTLIKAFKIVREKLKHYKLKLLLIGDGILRDKMEKLVSDLNLNEDVRFLGKISHKEIPFYHNMIDVHIYPSIWESFGVSNLEAAACEKPQIASNIGGFKEILRNNVDAFLVNPNSPEEVAYKAILLIENSELRNKMGKNARENVIKHFNWQNNIQEMIEEYYSILMKRK